MCRDSVAIAAHFTIFVHNAHGAIQSVVCSEDSTSKPLAAQFYVTVHPLFASTQLCHCKYNIMLICG